MVGLVPRLSPFFILFYSPQVERALNLSLVLSTFFEWAVAIVERWDMNG